MKRFWPGNRREKCAKKPLKSSPFEELAQLGSVHLLENVSGTPEAILDHSGLSVSVRITEQEDRRKPGSSVTLEQTCQPDCLQPFHKAGYLQTQCPEPAWLGQNSALGHTSYMSLNILPNLFEPPFPKLWKTANNSIYILRLQWMQAEHNL